MTAPLGSLYSLSQLSSPKFHSYPKGATKPDFAQDGSSDVGGLSQNLDVVRCYSVHFISLMHLHKISWILFCQPLSLLFVTTMAFTFGL